MHLHTFHTYFSMRRRDKGLSLWPCDLCLKFDPETFAGGGFWRWRGHPNARQDREIALEAIWWHSAETFEVCQCEQRTFSLQRVHWGSLIFLYTHSILIVFAVCNAVAKTLQRAVTAEIQQSAASTAASAARLPMSRIQKVLKAAAASATGTCSGTSSGSLAEVAKAVADAKPRPAVSTAVSTSFLTL